MRTVRCSGISGCLSRRVSAQGRVSVQGDVCQTPPLWTESQTGVKTLPCRNYVADGKNLSVHHTTLALIVTLFDFMLLSYRYSPLAGTFLYTYIYVSISISNIQFLPFRKKRKKKTTVFYIKGFRGLINNQTSLSLCSFSIMYSFVLLKGLSIGKQTNPSSNQ